MSTVSNLFALEVVQSCQHCQLCVLRENSIEPIELSDMDKTDESYVGIFTFVIMVEYCIG